MINIGKISMATKLRRFSLKIHISCGAINQTSTFANYKKERKLLTSNATCKQAQRKVVMIYEIKVSCFLQWKSKV